MTGTEHGTNNGYQNKKCRCGPCTEAHRKYNREWTSTHRDQARAASARYVRRVRATGAERSMHGTISRYMAGKCRCDKCVRTHSEYKKKRRLAANPQRVAKNILIQDMMDSFSAAQYLNVHVVTLRKRAASGEIPSLRYTEPRGPWFFRKQDLDLYLQRHRRGSA